MNVRFFVPEWAVGLAMAIVFFVIVWAFFRLMTVITPPDPRAKDSKSDGKF